MAFVRPTAIRTINNFLAPVLPGPGASSKTPTGPVSPAGLIQSGKDRDAVDKLLRDLDANGDAEVDFSEFVVFVAALTSACHKYFVQAAPK